MIPLVWVRPRVDVERGLAAVAEVGVAALDVLDEAFDLLG